jgi:hypothetical protein
MGKGDRPMLVTKSVKLTDAEYEALNDAIDAELYAARKGHAGDITRLEAAKARKAAWEAANALPTRTWEQRQARFAALAAFKA